MVKMKRAEYLLELRNHFDRLLKLSGDKSGDYTLDDNTYNNFNLIEVLTNGSITAEAGILTRMTDKVARIANLFVSKESRDSNSFESISDNLDDLAVYAMILRIALEQRRKNGNGDSNKASKGHEAGPDL